jgi:hypothetical protein
MPIITLDEARRAGIRSGSVHTIIAPKEFGLRRAQNWLKEHGFKASVRASLNTYRFSQGPEVEGARFYSKKMPNGLVFLFQSF